MPKKRVSSARAAAPSSSASTSSSSISRNNSSNSANNSGASSSSGNSALPTPSVSVFTDKIGAGGGWQLTPPMVREFFEAAKRAGMPLSPGIPAPAVDLNRLMQMANASTNATTANNATAKGQLNKGGSNNNNNNSSSRGKVTGVKILRQTVPIVGPAPPPPGGTGGKKPVAMGVSATYTKGDGSTATVDLDASAIAQIMSQFNMSQANSNNPEQFNAGLKQLLAVASSAAADHQRQTAASSLQSDSSFHDMSVFNHSPVSGKRNAQLANEIATSYGGGKQQPPCGEDSSNGNGGGGGNNNNETSLKVTSSSNNAQQQSQQPQLLQQQNAAQIQSLFSSLVNMAQQMESTSSSSQESSIQNDFASFRKAAFVAGMNVAMQQEAERNAQHELEKLNKKVGQQQQLLLQQKQQELISALQNQTQNSPNNNKMMKKESVSDDGNNSATTTEASKNNVFSMIFGGGGNKSNSSSSAAASSNSAATMTNNGLSSMKSNNNNGVPVPVIPPPPGGFPPTTTITQDSVDAQQQNAAASALAGGGGLVTNNDNDYDENSTLAPLLTLGNHLLRRVNMSNNTEEGARRAYETLMSTLNPEDRSIVDSFANNFAESLSRGSGGGPDDLINAMSKSLASVLNFENSNLLMDNLAREMDRLDGVGKKKTPPSSSLPQDRPTFYHHLPSDLGDDDDDDYDDTQTYDIEAELLSARAKEEAEEEERKRELKASKRRDKKARQRERVKKEAEAKATAAAIKKREKTITSWRSRVVAACTSGDAHKMDALIGESPYKNYIFNPPSSLEEPNDENNDDDGGGGPQNQEEYLLQELSWFLPNCLQKYSSSQTGGALSFDTPPFEVNDARELLAKYIISTSFDVFRQQVPTFSRNSIHSAAYANDVDFIKWVLHGSKDKEKDFLESPCKDAGWTPLHYATAGGAKSALEILMAEKCNVKARTDPSLTCFRTFTPYQSSNGLTALELAVVLQSGAVDDDLTSKAVILSDIVDKRIVNVSAADKSSYMRILKAIEERLKEVEKNGYWPLPDDDEQIALMFEANDCTDSMTLKKKPKKKNNKKKAKEFNPTSAPAAAAVSPPEAEVASPKQKSSSSDDLSDPVAIALLGMGFAEDQIKAAAIALGGYVGADDMVMWILSGGSTSATDQNDTSGKLLQSSQKQKESVASNTKSTLTKAQQQKAPTRAQKKAEEAARKRQEEIANAQKAAAKREEQRRLRREWNEREQARQEQEKNAKLAGALEKQRQAEMEKMVAEMSKKSPHPGIPTSINVGGEGGKGPPTTIVAGGKKAPKKSNMGIPQAPTVRAPKILARPNEAPNTSVGNQPLFSKPPPPPKSSPSATEPGKPSTHQPTMILKKGSGISASASEYHPQGFGSSFSVSDGSVSSAGSPVQQLYQAQSCRSVPPPGFRQVVPNASSYVEPNHTGTIRATAREFVPTSFANASPVTQSHFVPSMSAQTTTRPLSFPRTASSHENASNTPPAATPLIEPMSSLLSTVRSTSPAPATLAQTVGVDTTVSAVSSITGLSGALSEEKTVSRVGSIMTFESNTGIGGLQGSSILESISYGGADQNNGLGNIWGGTSNSNQNDTLGGFAGLNFSSFMEDDALSDDKKRDKRGNALGDNTWGNGAIGGGSIW